MRKIFAAILIVSSLFAYCDWNDDGIINILDIVATVEYILSGSGAPNCDWNGDDIVNILDIVATVECIITNCMDDDTVADIDGNIYQTVQIGDQEWMAENLKTTHYNNGDEIPTGWPSYDGAYAVYSNDPSNSEIYGNLYNWYAAVDDRGICPAGWHVPTDEEWMELEMELGMSYEDAHDFGYRGTDQGSQLAGNANLWNSGQLVSTPAFGSSGFLALPGGYRISYGNYDFVGSIGYFWSSSESGSDIAWYRLLYYGTSGVVRIYYYKRCGFSIRCVSPVES